MGIHKVGVLGCGLMGLGIEQVCATAPSEHTQIGILNL
jgi:3-hydroxyacyl-CoA dehydrogenase